MTEETPVKEPSAFKDGSSVHEKLDYLLEKVKDLLGENDSEPEAENVDTSLDLNKSS